MNKQSIKKYSTYEKVNLPDRKWPDKHIEKAPLWCSVDLRDGNQALVTPMTLDEKLDFFKLLVRIGFKDIEVGFPSASMVEFDFVRKLIEDKIIPEGVRVQVLVQSRKHLIEKTFAALQGSSEAIVHLYNSTSEQQRRIVFKKDKQEILDIAVQGVVWIKEFMAKTGTKVALEYSPESFTGTELDFALQVCNSVIDEWQPSADNKLIINLPATVELSTPNVFADRVEWMSRNLKNREDVIISVHTHNDRGCAVAAAELGVMAGAQRVEGTLLGNGERTGNTDLITMAMNMYTQGVAPALDFSKMEDIIGTVERINKLAVPERQPYSGSLVYTAFSGSHQDAIKKGMEYRKNTDKWDVPYLPIDPQDLGRTYEGIIRLNSQSGKGGVAYILEKEKGYVLPKAMHPELGWLIQSVADRTGQEVSPQQVIEAFNNEYLTIKGPIKFKDYTITAYHKHIVDCKLFVETQGEKKELEGSGNGPIDACKKALIASGIVGDFNISSYSEHALDIGSSAQAICYIEVELGNNKCFGVGIDADITLAAIKSLICALNRQAK